MAEISDDQIAEALLAPEEIVVDGQRIKNRSADDLIKGAEYLAAKTRTRRLFPGYITRLKPPGMQE